MSFDPLAHRRRGLASAKHEYTFITRPLVRVMLRYWWGFILVAIVGLAAGPIGVFLLPYDLGYTLGVAYGCLGLLLGLGRQRLKGKTVSLDNLTFIQRAGRIALVVIGVALFAAPFAWLAWVIVQH